LPHIPHVASELEQIAEHCAVLPILDPGQAEEILKQQKERLLASFVFTAVYDATVVSASSAA
jgi:hypothetical protein